MEKEKKMRVFPTVISYGKGDASIGELFTKLRDDIARTRDEAISAYHYLQRYKHLPQLMSYSAVVLLNATMAEDHQYDFQCLVDETKTCVICRAFHGEPCEQCRKRAYHGAPCVVPVVGGVH